ncbi:dymeclin isoform X6 [Homo sapiens]|uniref:dymeclin isoform X6 n=1 Tax=Homo sapiens TaxID=9606 RepID=UPI0005CFF3D1|nr:dymeclin isoform X6 [Homo sapiens]XP_054174677.1 dymeclin isoform X6 [Homo sapiens]|eukprot:XP_011524343.1 dymeclin isoform X8 [Homo sapiens]
MGSNSSRIGDLPKNEYLKKLSGTESISENDPFWNQLLSFSFPAPTSSSELKLLEEATISVCRSLVENNPRTGNLGALIKVFLSRTKELKLSAECQNHIFIWQTHNALFIICCLLKVFICQMSEEELQLHFTYEEKSPGNYSSDSEDLLEELLCCLMQLITDIPLLDITYEISVEAISTMVVFLSCQLFHKEVLRQSISHKYLMRGPCLPYTSKLVKTLLYNFIRQEKPPPPGAHVFPQQSDGGGLLYGLASGVATGLWTVFTLGGVGSKAAASPELSSPLANQSLLLLLVLANLTDASDAPNPYRQAIMSFKNTQDSSPFPSSIPHAFQINFNSLYTALCEQQTSDQATLLLYTLLHQNSNIRTYMLARTDMENLVLPILEILYHVEERNSHHVYMALIILLILTEDDGFNRSIHEVILKNITWYSERVLTEISLGSLLILVVIRTIQYNMTRTRDKYLHTNCLAALANMSAQFRSLHQYAAQRIISLFSLLSKKHNKVLEQATQSLRGSLSSNDVPLPDYVISFFSSRLLQAGAELSVERVLEIIKQGVVALPKDRLKILCSNAVSRWPIVRWTESLHARPLCMQLLGSHSFMACLSEISRIEIQICGRGAARGVFYPLCLVSCLQLSSRPVLESTGHPAVHHGFRLRAGCSPTRTPPAKQPFKFFYFWVTEVDRQVTWCIFC